MLGLDGLAEQSACGLPVSSQVQRLKLALTERFGRAPEIPVVDLYELDPDEQGPAIDAVVSGELSPFVVVNGRLVCTGTVDVAAVLGALA